MGTWRRAFLCCWLAACGDDGGGGLTEEEMRLQGRYTVNTVICDDGEGSGCISHHLLGVATFEITFTEGQDFAVLTFAAVDGTPLVTRFAGMPGGCAAGLEEPSELALTAYMAEPNPDGLYSDGCARACDLGCDATVYSIVLDPGGLVHYDVLLQASRL